MPYVTKHVRVGQLAIDDVIVIGGVGFVVDALGFSEDGQQIIYFHQNLDASNTGVLILPVYMTLSIGTPPE